ncbi:MAG: RbsD or FucU transport [Bacteroidetes bacterium]|nr:RbsD or FucU transport [Bacteroidota bacterium]
MLINNILHPEILKVLATAGHGSGVVIADGNFPFGSMAGRDVPRVYLNFAPDKLNTIDVLKEIAKAVPLEGAQAPVPDDGSTPPIFKEYIECLPDDITIEKLDRFGFYAAVKDPSTALLICTGETRVYSCIKLIVGVRKF